MNDTPRIQVPQKAHNPTDAQLQAPGSPGLRDSLLYLGGEDGNPIAFAGAVLGVSWKGNGRPKAKRNLANLTKYGLEVYDEVVSREGVTRADFWKAAGRAIELLVEAAGLDPDEEEVGHAEGNSEPAVEPA